MSWLRRLFTRKQMEADLDRELSFHFESQVADKVRSGIAENEARRLTRIEFGGAEQIKEAERRGIHPACGVDGRHQRDGARRDEAGEDRGIVQRSEQHPLDRDAGDK